LITLLQAIAREEGYYEGGIPPDRPERNNNPGDLLWGPEAKRLGATHGDPTYAVFPDIATGWQALKGWLSVPAKFAQDGSLDSGYLGATLRQIVYRFAPPTQNDSASYLKFVCSQAGLTPETVITIHHLT
jgi:hypothetical protein